jgi:hypothetical protein
MTEAFSFVTFLFLVLNPWICQSEANPGAAMASKSRWGRGRFGIRVVDSDDETDAHGSERGDNSDLGEEQFWEDG